MVTSPDRVLLIVFQLRRGEARGRESDAVAEQHRQYRMPEGHARTPVLWHPGLPALAQPLRRGGACRAAPPPLPLPGV